MAKLNLKKTVGLFSLGLLALWAVGTTAVLAETPAVDPAAVHILKRMTDYLGSLKQFRVTTQNTIEDLTDSDHRVDYDVFATVWSTTTAAAISIKPHFRGTSWSM